MSKGRYGVVSSCSGLNSYDSEQGERYHVVSAARDKCSE